jgi:hypothetical protein
MTIQIGDASANAVWTDIVSQNQALAALNAAVTIQLRGQSTCTIQVTAIGSQTLVFEGTTDGTNFYTLNVFPIGIGSPITSTTTTGNWIVVVAGMYQFRVRCSAYTSGSATVSVVASQGTNEQQVTVGNAQASATAGQLGSLVQGAVTTAAPTYTTGQTNPVSLTTTGALRSAIVGNTGVAVDAASGATAPTNAVAIGLRALNANPTAVANGQLVLPAADLAGRLITQPLNYRTLIKTQATTIAATTETTIITAGGASVFNDLIALIITTAGVAAATITIRDVTAGGTPWIIDYPNAALAPSVPFIVNFCEVPMQQGTANSAWTITNSVATTIHVTAQYVQRLA